MAWTRSNPLYPVSDVAVSIKWYEDVCGCKTTVVHEEIIGLLSRRHFADQPERPDVVRFVSVLGTRPRSSPLMPLSLPPTGKWLLKILAREGRFVFGVYRRHMKVISYLGKIDGLFGVSATTHNWNTIAAIAKALDGGATARR